MRKNNKGFTLIELLVVIAIIGLLSTLAVVSLNNARQKSRDAKRVSDIKSIQTALELYYVDNDSYPVGTALELGEGTDCTTACDTISSTNGIAASASGTTYMGLIPTDPNSTGTECTGSGDAAGCTYSYSAFQSDGTTACASEPCAQYEIDFYLEGATGDLGVGSNCATEAGIGSTCP